MHVAMRPWACLESEALSRSSILMTTGPDEKSAGGTDYVLATGDAAAIRLRLLDDIFGPATRELLTHIGLTAGWRAADVGCGTGLVASWIGRQVGASGAVSAVDLSAEQLRHAEDGARAAGLANITFHQASAYDTGLPREAFDLAYCRLLMCHLARPADALRKMRALCAEIEAVARDETTLVVLARITQVWAHKD
jgi:SAM-dependent methyltransferase